MLWRRLPVSILLSAQLMIVGPVALAIAGRHIVWATWTRVLEWGGQRYFLLPVCAFIFLVAAWLDTFPHFRFSLVALLLPFTFGITGNFRVPPYPDMNWPSQAYRVREWLATGRAVSIPVPPGPTWAVDLPDLAQNDSPCGGPSGWLRAEAVDAAHAGPVISISGWRADPAWTRNGFHASVGTLAGETLFGSYSGRDANVGTLTSAPFDAGPAGCIVLPIAHGPSIVGQSIRLVAADSCEDLGGIRLDESTGNWRYWAVHFSRDATRLRIVAKDQGAQFGQWVAVGEPHVCL
jgi:hypothetical protein